MSSPAGNRTPVSRVTGGDTNHYTTEDLTVRAQILTDKAKLEKLPTQKPEKLLFPLPSTERNKFAS